MRKNLGIYFQDKPIQILEHLNSFDLFFSLLNMLTTIFITKLIMINANYFSFRLTGKGIEKNIIVKLILFCQKILINMSY